MGSTLNAVLMIPTGDRATLRHMRLTGDDPDEISAVLKALRIESYVAALTSWPKNDVEIEKTLVSLITIETGATATVGGRAVSAETAQSVDELKKLIANSTPRSRLFIGLR